jgi:hypothetical protein
VPLSDEQQKHLEFIQGIVSRQASNSFLIKGWALTLTVALCGFAIGRNSWALATLAIGPILIFGWLDWFFFREERRFRCLYQAVIDGQPHIPPFSLDTMPVRDNPVANWPATVRSLPYVVLYASLLLGAAIVTIVLATAS